ncbi:MAG: HD-GYP domain-containing protein, partial [Halanaerobiales bacterium]
MDNRENKITIIYLIFGVVWIIFSDSFVLNLTDNLQTINTYQSYKGLLYVTITTLLLYLLLRKTFTHLRKQQRQLQENYKELQKCHRAEEEFQQELIISFTQILELHDPYTEGHSRKVATLSKNIAQEMELTKNKAEKAYWAGIVHDIGKILIPKKILNKNGSLTDNEYEKIKKHPIWGYRALSHSRRLKDIAKIILHHHEHWDGKGYPYNLKKEEI